jgi:hypothetical protein
MKEFLLRLVAPPRQFPLPARHRKPRLLYAVNHCYPFSSNGYAVRTHGVASALEAERRIAYVRQANAIADCHWDEGRAQGRAEGRSEATKDLCLSACSSASSAP